MAKVFLTVKAWAVPLARTFLAVFLASLVAGVIQIDFSNFEVSDLSVIGSLVLGALGVAANAVVLAVQKLLPGVPDPQPIASPVA